MRSFGFYLRKNRTFLITMAVLATVLVFAIRGMETQEWVITLLRGLSTASVIFLVASGFSLIFGLLDVLNLAHGALYMLGAYIAWTVYIRPDTFIDVLPPVLLIAAAFLLLPAWDFLAKRLAARKLLARIWPWIGLLAGGLLLFFALRSYPITIWNARVFSNAPGTYSVFADSGFLLIPPAVGFDGKSPVLIMAGILLGSLMLTFSLAGLQNRRNTGRQMKFRLPWTYVAGFVALLVIAILILIFNTPLTTAFISLGSNWLFVIAIFIALVVGALLGSFIESTLIRPLYSRPVYQLMITMGISAVIVELVRAVWGRPEFTLPKPEFFDGTGGNCPASTLAGIFRDHCSTIWFMDSRIRVYNEILIPLVGVVVLIAIGLLLKKTRIGMIIRAGVQDREMVEALGINVRRVFTFVFALGVGLAALGGALGGPSTGISTSMGDSMILNALIALAIGGLTSFPGAALGSLILGLMQQFIIKYGQIGINIPFLEEAFKPSPPLVPASTVLLMVIILLVLPNGLLGRKE